MTDQKVDSNAHFIYVLFLWHLYFELTRRTLETGHRLYQGRPAGAIQ